LNKKDELNKKVDASGSEKLKDKYSEMEQQYEEVKKQAFEPQIQGLEQAKEKEEGQINQPMH